MHLITKSCVLFLWMQTLDFVKSECTLEQFRNSNFYDENFDVTNLATSYPFGKQVRVSCSVGYSGFFKLTCTENGWLSTGSKCQPRSCGHPGDAEFADFHLEDGDDFVFGSRIIYTCHKGYQMVSRKNFRRCMAQGWDGVIPICEAQRCPTIKVADNMMVIGDVDEANYGNVLRFSCKYSHHVLEGEVEIYCKESGEWSSNPPECTEVTCNTPQIRDGSVPGGARVYKENEYLTFVCNEGYNRVGERPSKCSKVGNRAEWSPTPMCEPINCRVTLLPGTRYEPSQNIFSPGDTLRVTCGQDQWISDRGTSSIETRCKNDGRWTIDPVCREYRCSRPPDQSVYSFYANGGQETKVGDTAWYSCKTGYKKPVNNGRATCTRRGWIPDPLCIEITCPRKDYPDAEIVADIKSVYKYNQRVQYACNNGFDGTFSITCMDYGWSRESQRCQEIYCDRHDIEDARISNNKARYQHNEEVRYTCSYGKTLTLRCDSGAWIGPKVCSVCPKATIANGFFAGPYDDKLYFACNEGYKPFTKGWWGEAKCEDGQLPGLHKCIGKDECGEPPRIPNGKISDTGLITCNEGYFDQLNHQLNCHEGNWNSNGVPLKNICQPTPGHCGPPPKVENAVVVGAYKKEYLAGSEVTYQCRDKYTPEAEHRLRCIAGRWEDKNIHCIPYCERFTDERQTMTFTAQKDMYLNGEVINYTCLVSENKGTATCMNNEWITTVTCEAKTCPDVEILHGYYQYLKGSELIYGASIKYFCDEGYKLVSETDTNECLIDGWGNPSPICKRMTCELSINHPNLRVNPQPDENEPFTAGQRLQFSCTDDFSLKGSAEIECLPTGLWSEDVPTCSEKCRVTEPPPNVNVDHPVGSRVNEGEQLTFSCRLRTHVIKGKTSIDCLANAEWSDEFPTCGSPSYCEKPPNLLNGDTVGIASKSQYNHGEEVEYICQRFYTMEGQPRMTCINGEWTGEMKCLKPCTVDKTVMSERNIQFRYGYEEKLYSPHKDSITFSCTRGKHHDGQERMRQMCNDGVMNLPRCV